MSNPSAEGDDLPIRHTGPVSISPWVNERFPGWDQILSAHEVARLTRRPRWVLSSLALVGRFPKQHRYHGRRIGWLRSDIIDWLTNGLSTSHGENSAEAMVGPPRASTCLCKRCLNAQTLLRPSKPVRTSRSAEHQARLALEIPCRKRALRCEAAHPIAKNHGTNVSGEAKTRRQSPVGQKAGDPS